MGDSAGLTTFFVYGTLKPDGLYWARIAGLVVFSEPAKVRGDLYDTGLGYPAAVFGGDGVVDGVLVHVAAAQRDHALEIMDEIEDEGREYRRVDVTTLDGRPAAAYEWMLPTTGLARIEGF